MYATRPTLYGTRHAVSAGHYLAAAAGFAVLEAGGNAIDAGCAAGIALAVLQPDEVNFAGVAPIMIRTADGAVETIAGLGHWPQAHPRRPVHARARREDPARRPAHRRARRARCLDHRAARHGTMGFGDVAAAAIRYRPRRLRGLSSCWPSRSRTTQADYARWPGNAAIFLPGGRPPRVGERFVQPTSPRTLQHMADEERSAAGRGREAGLARRARRLLPRRHRPRRSPRTMAENGGYLTREDLAAFRSRIEPRRAHAAGAA